MDIEDVFCARGRQFVKRRLSEVSGSLDVVNSAERFVRGLLKLVY